MPDHDRPRASVAARSGVEVHAPQAAELHADAAFDPVADVERVEILARVRLARELAALPGWGTPALWARVGGADGGALSLGALAALLAEARAREDAEVARALFTRLLARIEPGSQRWAASVAGRTPGLSPLARAAVREDLCQELALRLWQRLALEPSEPWQLFFQRALEYERRHVATAYMERNGYWVRAAHRRAGVLSRPPALLASSWEEWRALSDVEGASDLGPADLADLSGHVLLLPARERAAVVLRFWQGVSEAEIAAALGVTTRTVRNLLRRAYARLRATYGDTEET